jgi:hypothetical protein
MTILVIADYSNDPQDNKVLAPATLNTVAAAAKIAGVSKVPSADNAAYAHQLPENVAPLVAALVQEAGGARATLQPHIDWTTTTAQQVAVDIPHTALRESAGISP